MNFMNWVEFVAAAEELYEKNPVRTLYTVKYTKDKQTAKRIVVLTVTDKSVHYRYTARQDKEKKNLIEFTDKLMQSMASGPVPSSSRKSSSKTSDEAGPSNQKKPRTAEPSTSSMATRSHTRSTQD